MQYSDTDLFLDAITLLIHINDAKSKDIVKQVIAISKEGHRHFSAESKLIKFYISLAETIMNMNLTIDNSAELSLLLIKFKSDPAFYEHHEVYDTLRDVFSRSEKFTEDNLAFIVERLQNTIIWNKANASVKKQFANLTRCQDVVDPHEQRRYLQNVLQAAQDIQMAFTDTFNASDNLIEQVDFSDKASIERALSTYKERKQSNTMKLGLQGLNRMFGGRGPSMGESIVFNALQHNYKSGMLMSMAKWIVKYNVPPKVEGRKPMVLFVSLENENFENTMWWFKSIYETTFNKSADGMSISSMSEYIYQYFNEKGYTFNAMRYQPTNFGFNELAQLVESYERDGYFIVATIIDYMNNMKKAPAGTNSSNVGNYLLVRELYRNTCNFTKNRGCLLVSAHQLNRAAQQLVGQTANVVKNFNNSHMADSMDVQREVDTSIYLHNECNQIGEKYLTMKRDKRRYDNTTPEKDCYCAYKFGPFGIVDDVDGPDMSVRDIYAQADLDGSQKPANISALF